MPCHHQAPNLALNQTSPARGLFLSGIDAGPPVSLTHSNTPLHAETMSVSLGINSFCSAVERDALLRCVPVPYSLRWSVRLHRRDTALHRRRRRVHLTLSDRLAVGRFEDEKRLSPGGLLAFIAFVVGGIGLY